MEKKQQVLIVEDEQNIVDILRFNLRKEEFTTPKRPTTGEVGLALALQEAPDLILLDLMLPKMNGFEVCKRLRDQGRSTPVIIITAREAGKGQDPGPGFGGGRLHHQALLRAGAAGPGEGQHPPGAMAPRPPPRAGGEALRFGRLVIQKGGGHRHQGRGGPGAHPREFELLAYLAAHAGRGSFPGRSSWSRVWNYEGYVGDVRAVDVAIRRLREKIEDDPAQPKYIITRRGRILLPTGAVTRQGRGENHVARPAHQTGC